MAKSVTHHDVLVLGEHPATYLAAARLRFDSKLSVLHATIPDQPTADRLVLLNPALFELHPLLENLRRKLDLTAVYGVRFLADDPPTASEFRAKCTLAHVGSYQDIRDAMIKVARAQQAELVNPKELRIVHLDEKGVDFTLGRETLRAKALILGGQLPEAQQRLLALEEGWEHELIHRYSFVRLKGNRWLEPNHRPLMHMSLDLRQTLSWGWLFPHKGEAQIAVEQPVDSLGSTSPRQLMEHWVNVLRRHEVLKQPAEVDLDSLESIDIPMAGALAHEGVANRTLLIGPAGGFYSATAEDIYPNCWSALFAAEVMKKALREEHLQDALQAFRHKWRTTLGDYLRGPQQNLRFLLPLVYRNQVMTQRLVESILEGKSVVR